MQVSEVDTKAAAQDAETEQEAKNAPYWKVIKDAIKAAETAVDPVKELWNTKVKDAYVELAKNGEGRKSKGYLRPAIKRLCKDIECAEVFKEYDAAVRSVQRKDGLEDSFTTAFSNLDYENQLFCGQYECTDAKIVLDGECVCNHGLYISKTISPIDDVSEEHVELSYFGNGKWNTKIVPSKTLAEGRQITKLSSDGIDVTSQNSGKLIDYLRTLNYWGKEGSPDTVKDENGQDKQIIRRIPLEKGYARFGWRKDEFLPYTDKLHFTGEAEYKTLSDAICEDGELEKWVEVVKPYYKTGAQTAPRLVIDAAIASLLVGYTDGLIFWVHLFGGSGKGKTVSLKLAASIFGNPSAEGGGLIQTFSSTQVGLERRAEMLCNMPLLIDELGAKNASNQDITAIVYQLTEGVGKVRGSKEGGTQRVAHWHNVCISSGEHPITSSNSLSGIINRIISLDVNGKNIYGDGDQSGEFLDTISANYGKAAKPIINFIVKLGRDKVKQAQRCALKELTEKKPDGMNKQLIAASWLATADAVVQRALNIDGDGDMGWLLDLVKTEDEVDIVARVIQWLDEYRATNGKHFFNEKSEVASDIMGNQADVWGKQWNGLGAYVPKELRRNMREEGYNYEGFVAAAKARGLVVMDNKEPTKLAQVWIGGHNVRCLVLKSQPRQTSEGHSEPLHIQSWHDWVREG